MTTFGKDLGVPGTGISIKPDNRSARERIEAAKEQARAAREAQGLPPVDDGPFTAEALRKRKRRR